MVRAQAPFVLAWRAWKEFLFASVNPARIAALRIAFGVYLVYYYVDLFPLLELYHFPPALLPPRELRELGPSLMSLVNYGAAPRTAAYLLMLLSAAALALGLQTRVAAALAWALNQAFMGPLPAGRNSGDNAVAVACFLMLVAAVAGHAQKVHALDARGGAKDEVPSVPAWTLRLFQIQLVFVYFFSGFHKLGSRDWYLGEALFYVFQQRGWARFDLSGLDEPVLVGLATYGTLAFELLIFPVLVWFRPLRPYVLAAGALFHLGIAATLRVFVFGAIMPLLYLAFADATPLLEWTNARCRAVRGAWTSRGAGGSAR